MFTFRLHPCERERYLIKVDSLGQTFMQTFQQGGVTADRGLKAKEVCWEIEIYNVGFMILIEKYIVTAVQNTVVSDSYKL